MAEAMSERLVQLWRHTDRIFDLLEPGAILAQPIALRHPFIFYLGHLPAFAWNHVGAGVLDHPSLNRGFDDLFSRGIDPDVEDPDRCHDHPDAPERWPEPAAVLEYRDRVREAILEAPDAMADRAADHVMAQNGRVFEMVIEHEMMHQETLLYMLQRLAGDRKVRPAWLPDHVSGPGRPIGPVTVPPGPVTLGADFRELPFGWDNEFPATSAAVPAFRIDATPVTNAQFLEFVGAGGYERADAWGPEGWAWRSRERLAHPICWERHDGQWLYRTLFDLLPMPLAADWPVYVSQAEARAYARWHGGRLPTEAEFHRAAFADPGGGARLYPWGADEPGPAHGNLDFRQWSPTPVGTHPAGASAWGVHDLLGDGWEWTETPFHGFPGFAAYIPGYPGYSADFFDGKHYVLKGASWATAAGLLRPSFRNWFQAHYPYVFAKFRCVTPP